MAQVLRIATLLDDPETAMCACLWIARAAAWAW